MILHGVLFHEKTQSATANVYQIIVAVNKGEYYWKVIYYFWTRCDCSVLVILALNPNDI